MTGTLQVRRSGGVEGLLAKILFQRGHDGQHNVFAPGSGRDLDPDRKAGGALFRSKRKLLQTVAACRAIAFFPRLHAGGRDNPAGNAEHI